MKKGKLIEDLREFGLSQYVDDKEICVRIDNVEEPDFIWSDNPELVNVFKTYFKELWERGKGFAS